jgi:nitrate reductase gamma subunit
MSSTTILLWIVIPYLCLTVFVVGHFWRYRYDKFGWTTRSSQLYESAILRWASPLFHFGILVVALGHIAGILIPERATVALGVSEAEYHLSAIGMGGVAGFCTLVGMALLIYRRRTVGPVFSATTANDKMMYALLGLVIVLGLCTTALGNAVGGGYDYRLTVSPWLRSLFLFQPQAQLMAGAPILFQLHALAALALFAAWPFTRLVHVWSAPLGYLTRPYIVYRSRDPRAGLRGARRGWERIPTKFQSPPRF